MRRDGLRKRHIIGRAIIYCVRLENENPIIKNCIFYFLLVGIISLMVGQKFNIFQ